MTADDDSQVPVNLPADLLERMEAISRSLDAVAARLQQVATAQVTDRTASRNTRRLAYGLGASLVLDVVLTVVVTLLSLSALNQGNTLHASQLAACAIGNQSKAEQEALWGYLFQLSGGAKTTQQKEFLAYVDKTFAPVDCARVYQN
jgi:hypothetical protein